jgi:hypothetical protein
LLSYNIFAYCANNPVMRIDPTGCWSWTDVFNTAAIVAVAAVAAAVIICSGGSAAPPLLAAASAIAGTTVTASAAASTAIAVAVTSTVVMGTAAIASAHQMMNKPTSQNQMQKQVESRKAPKEVDRVDKPHVNAPNQQNHIHFKDGTAINMDGSLSHESRGIPQITKAILEWIITNGWSAPTF